MGAYWSSAYAKGREILIINSTCLRSPPVGKLCSSVDLSISLSDKELRQLQQYSPTAWKVDFEVDVAHRQKRYTLLNVPANLEDNEYLFHIPATAFTEMAGNPELTIDDLCNVGAIHIGLVSNEPFEAPLATATVVVDVPRARNETCTSASELMRIMYGAVCNNVSADKTAMAS